MGPGSPNGSGAKRWKGSIGDPDRMVARIWGPWETENKIWWNAIQTHRFHTWSTISTYNERKSHLSIACNVKYAIPVFEVRQIGSLCPSFSGNRLYVVVSHCHTALLRLVWIDLATHLWHAEWAWTLFGTEKCLITETIEPGSVRCTTDWAIDPWL